MVWGPLGSWRTSLQEDTGTLTSRSLEEVGEEAITAGISVTVMAGLSGTAVTMANALTFITTTTAVEAATETIQKGAGTREMEQETRQEMDVIDDTKDWNNSVKKRTEI